MEIEGEDGTRVLIKKGSKRELGRRELGSGCGDRTVSRCHVSFELQTCVNKDPTDPDSETRVLFEVVGKNPIWLCSSRSREITVLRRFEKGEMEVGYTFCVSAKEPIWFTLKRVSKSGNELAERLQRGDEDLGFESLDVSDIDPVKEFGFLVLGHEFNHYPKQMIRDIKNWDWFLEEPGEDSEDDEVREKKGKKGLRRKRKKGDGNGDDDWKGESEDDKELIAKLRKVQRPKYSSTRSKECSRNPKDTKSSKTYVQKKPTRANEEDDENEDDNSLGGFIVNDDDGAEQEEEVDEEKEEEEEDYNEDDDEEEIEN